MAVKPIPEGYRSVTPYLCVKDAAKAMGFYKKALGAKERMRMEHGGKITHAEVEIGDSLVMLADEFPDMNFHGPKTVGGTPVHLHVYVEDVDQVVDRASTEGAKIVKPVKDQFYGDRSGTIEDPFGHVWHIATHVEDLSDEEMRKRSAEEMRKQSQ